MLRPLCLALLLVCLSACGGRSGLSEQIDAQVEAPPIPRPERCDGLDDDLDGDVDEDFRDAEGRYVDDAHCGGCGRACGAPSAPALGLACEVVEGRPVCAATACEPGFARSRVGTCVRAADHLCLPCVDDSGCGLALGVACADIGGERRCTMDCALGCPDGYVCGDGSCVPSGGSCSCDAGDTFDLACALEDPSGARCPGVARCEAGSLSACVAAVERCDGQDDDCDGSVDEDFRDARGAYTRDPRHCGACGVDCTGTTPTGLALSCGGDPLAPSCVLACPDAVDGVAPGDHLDADRDIATGCECEVSALEDVAGPAGRDGEALDENCDGADGVVVESFYVATDGDDRAIGSPTRPLRTLTEAFSRAAASLSSEAVRSHVFVASGLYVESIVLPDGVSVHGGYRRDFRAHDPSGYLVEVQAPSDTDAPGGAALVARGAGLRPTLIEWVSLRGRDGVGLGGEAFAAYIEAPGSALTLRELELRAGVPGAGRAGVRGAAGQSPTSAAATGARPRVAVEDEAHACVSGSVNTVVGGAGGVNSCAGASVAGGHGGASACPSFGQFEGAGSAGAGVGGGRGGAGGQASEGPISGPACPDAPYCCGLADFTVPSDFRSAAPGANGRDGASGEGGLGCEDPFGRFVGDAWSGYASTGGRSGAAGSGGGGGGAGGGTYMAFQPPWCEFADGLGGGGGGGGAGACGGAGGLPGSSGGPSIALVLRLGASGEVPRLEDCVLRTADGGRGGDGGAGGTGGYGGVGAPGGELRREERTTPSLAGPFGGARGGSGGAGGSGGGGGGGCGGPSIGVYIVGRATLPAGAAGYSSVNSFDLGAGGDAGRGGGGAHAGAAGEVGGAFDVIAR